MGSIQQGQVDDGRAQVRRDQLTDFAGTVDVGVQEPPGFRGCHQAVGHHRTAIEALLRHPLPAGRGGPQRAHEGAVHARYQVQVVVDPAQGLHVLRTEDIALAAHGHGDAQGVAGKSAGVLEVVEGEGMMRGYRLQVAGIELNWLALKLSSSVSNRLEPMTRMR